MKNIKISKDETNELVRNFFELVGQIQERGEVPSSVNISSGKLFLKINIEECGNLKLINFEKSKDRLLQIQSV